ncbi:MAG: aldose epimerase [Actinomycetota bacterium]|nr:aldose epimerase [Actinomycetota bacterium]
MVNPGPAGWDQPGDVPRLARHRYRPTRAVLGRWSIGKHRSEARRGESLDQLLTERVRQFRISHGEQRATIVEVGGGLRRYCIGERDLPDGYTRTERCAGARGLPLIPWPNRIQDGAYTFDGVGYQVPLTEPENHNAIHGFLRWRNWTCHLSSGDRVVMGTVLHRQVGYPFTLDVSVEDRLDEDGLTVRATATNIGEQPCPYGAGQHPYLSLGTDLIDACELQLDAGRWLPTDDRGLPAGHVPLAGSDYDFRSARQIGAQDIDYTFTDLARDDDGRAWVRGADHVRVQAERLAGALPAGPLADLLLHPQPHTTRAAAEPPLPAAVHLLRPQCRDRAGHPTQRRVHTWSCRPT